MCNLREELKVIGVSVTMLAAVDTVKEAIKSRFKENLKADIDYPLETLYILQWVEKYFIQQGYTKDSVLQTITDTQMEALFNYPKAVVFAIRATLNHMRSEECVKYDEMYSAHLFGENNSELNIMNIIASTLSKDTHLFA